MNTGLPKKTNYWWDVQVSSRYGNYIEAHQKMAVDRSIKILSDKVDKTVLDYGCGSGSWSLYLAAQGFTPIGVDISEEALRIYLERLPQSIGLKTSSDIKQLPLKNETVDLVIVISFSQPFTWDWFLREAYRILKPKGILVGTLQNRLSWRGFLQRARARVTKLDNPFKLSWFDFRRRVEGEGFEVIYKRGFAWLPIPSRWRNSDLIPFFAFFERALFLRHFPWVSPNTVFLLRKGR